MWLLRKSRKARSAALGTGALTLGIVLYLIRLGMKMAEVHNPSKEQWERQVRECTRTIAKLHDHFTIDDVRRLLPVVEPEPRPVSFIIMGLEAEGLIENTGRKIKSTKSGKFVVVWRSLIYRESPITVPVNSAPALDDGWDEDGLLDNWDDLEDFEDLDDIRDINLSSMDVEEFIHYLYENDIVLAKRSTSSRFHRPLVELSGSDLDAVVEGFCEDTPEHA